MDGNLAYTDFEEVIYLTFLWVACVETARR